MIATNLTEWTLKGNWTMNTAEGNCLFAAVEDENASVRYDGCVLDNNWEVSVQIHPVCGKVCVLLYGADGEEVLSAAVTMNLGEAELTVEDRIDDGWQVRTKSVQEIRCEGNAKTELRVNGCQGKPYLKMTLFQNGKELYCMRCRSITEQMLDGIVKAGIGADQSTVFENFSVRSLENPMEDFLKTISREDGQYYLKIAGRAVQDILDNFWTGDTKCGKIRPTNSGLSNRLGDPRGSIWETSMLILPIYDMWRITGDDRYYEYLTAEAKFFREEFTEEDLTHAGANFHWAFDDCVWNAQMYLLYYKVTGDDWFVDCAIGLMDRSLRRWYCEEMNDIYYDSTRNRVSLYNAGAAAVWLRIWEITGEQKYYDLALRTYESSHVNLSKGRNDGIYFAEIYTNADAGIGPADQIHMGWSTSFLAGNLCMAALSAKFYRLTGKQEYLNRVYNINKGLLKYYNADGILLNDRDAWTDGTYTALYVSEMKTVPGAEEILDLVKNTAVSIVTNARTVDGYYSGRWGGPADGWRGIWGYYNEQSAADIEYILTPEAQRVIRGSTAEQSMTTGTSVLMVVAAAVLEAGLTHYSR